MKKILLVVVMFFLSVGTFASIKLTSGDVKPVVKACKEINISLDLSNVKYKKTLPFADFLAKATRADDWEESSLRCFMQEMNKKTFRYGFESHLASENVAAKYILVIVPANVKGNGEIEGEALLKEVSTGQVVAKFDVASDDGDDDDDITLRDALRDLGETFGKYFCKLLKSDK